MGNPGGTNLKSGYPTLESQSDNPKEAQSRLTVDGSLWVAPDRLKDFVDGNRKTF